MRRGSKPRENATDSRWKRGTIVTTADGFGPAIRLTADVSDLRANVIATGRCVTFRLLSTMPADTKKRLDVLTSAGCTSDSARIRCPNATRASTSIDFLLIQRVHPVYIGTSLLDLAYLKVLVLLMAIGMRTYGPSVLGPDLDVLISRHFLANGVPCLDKPDAIREMPAFLRLVPGRYSDSDNSTDRVSLSLDLSECQRIKQCFR